jgi:hypothetical protein
MVTLACSDATSVPCNTDKTTLPKVVTGDTVPTVQIQPDKMPV